ncbi:MAG: adenylate/guanylate cyclase domain-containing protein [Saprospiraceae bacterium]
MLSGRKTLFLWLLLCLLTVRAAGQEDFDNAPASIEALLEKANAAPNATAAVRAARQALHMAENSRSRSLLLRAHHTMAQVSLRAKEPDTAIVHFLEAAKMAEKLGNADATLAEINESIGDIFMRSQLYAKAIPYYSQALQHFPDRIALREKMGDALLLDGKITLADSICYERVIAHYSAEGNLAAAVGILQKLADACNRARFPERGVDYYLRMQPFVERIGSAQEKALLYNNLGYQYYLARDPQAALENLEKAKSLCETTPNACAHPELYLTNLGIVLHNMGDSKKGIQYLLQARDAVLLGKDKKALTSLEHLIAKTYFGANDFYNALSYNGLAIKHARETKQDDIWRNACKTAAEIYLELYDHENAIQYYRDYLRLDDSLRQVGQSQQRALLSQQSLLERTEQNTQLMLREQTIKDLYSERIRREQENLRLESSQLALIARQKEDSLRYLQSQQLISKSEEERRTLELLRLNQSLQFEAKQRAAEQEVAELRRREELERARQLAKDSIGAQELKIYQQRAEIADLQIRQQENFRKFAYGLGILGAVILGLLGFGWWLARRSGRRLAAQNRRIEAQKSLIEAERSKSDGLLLNILPEEIAAELKVSGEATPRKYEQATVLFTDFVNFSRLAEDLSPEQLIAELNECFLAFDHISERYGLEKIKTIGDAYMCAGGVPVPNDTHATDAVQAAREMMDWLKSRNRQNPSAVFREMRIGIHTGPVIAGVVGKNKFAYDIWGDAVNLAARLEEHGAPGQINISSATFQLVRERFACTHRGKKEVYNKGAVDMYFVEG